MENMCMGELVTLEEIRAAQRRLAGVAERTGLYRVEPERLMAACGALGVRAEGSGASANADALPFALYLKAESEQPIGSFKLRGAYNRVAQMSAEELARGVITYSSGNHGQGVAYAARALGAQAVVVMPENAPAVKIEATAALGAQIVLVGPSSEERRARALELAAAHGYTVIPPYDDRAIVAGQATCGLEILEQLRVIAGEGSGADSESAHAGKVVILSPVSGGGLLSGVATAVKLAAQEVLGRADVEVWGVEPELAADAKESFETRTLVEWPAERTARTTSDGLRTQSLGRLNFAHILRYVDGILTVSEEEIAAAMRAMLMATGLVAEPSGAVTLAAALFHHAELPPCHTMVAILSGRNV